jgi:hypothetical protein
MAIKVILRNRIGSYGARYVLPFINGKRVCDIPSSSWSSEVETALAIAYELGRQSAADEIAAHLKSIPTQITAQHDGEDDDGH